MRMVDLIMKKREGMELSPEEIRFIVNGYTDGTIPDYQMSAWAMAVLFRGMTARETAELTLAMADSGERIDLSDIPGIKVDKHSTGGVGDKTTLVVAPLVAAAGIPVAKMSGRGLGFSGGTIDKLESIPGFQAELSREQFIRQVKEVGVAVIGQTGNLTPADKKLYALRDVTGTVEAVPLIASSIMSKKIAAGADAIILDVKTGRGAFMKTVAEAEELARAMVAIGREMDRRTVAVISDMNQPLGRAVGNALEVEEAIQTLRGQGPRDLTELALAIGGRMLLMAGKADSLEAAREQLAALMHNGRALETFRRMVAAQGGDLAAVDDPTRLPQASVKLAIRAARGGFVSRVDAEQIGRSSVLLGAGRTTKEMAIDLAVGIVLEKKVGDPVEAGDVLAVIYANDEARLASVAPQVEAAFAISAERPPEPALIHKIVDSADPAS